MTLLRFSFPGAVLFGSALAVAMAIAPAARAFCRTTTEPPTSLYIPSQTGRCWTTPDGGPAVDLAWPSRARIGYSVASGASKYASLLDIVHAAEAAFGAWNNATCPPGCVGPACGHPNVQAFDEGFVSAEAAADDCGIVDCGARVHDPQHVIVFDDDAWPHSDPNYTVALTTVTYGVVTGTIFDADTEINSAQHVISLSDPAPAGQYSLQFVLTHEAGHFLGLAHATTTDAIMYYDYQYTPTALHADDIDGICAIYPPLPTQASGGCAITQHTRSGSCASGCVLIGLLAWCRTRRLRGPNAPTTSRGARRPR
jgi:hypothetical protein